MKTIVTFVIALQFTCIVNAQNVGIGTTSPQAALDVSSTTQGFLPPRMSIAQRNAITDPVPGLLLFCTDCDELQLYNGTIWKTFSGTAACIIPTPSNVSICSQQWSIKNLDVATYKNGESIPNVTDAATWAGLTTGAWCWFQNDSATYAATYGRLYNWYALNDPRGIAPAGWHIPTDAEWTTLSTCLGGESDAGNAMKEVGTAHWTPTNTDATNSSGFTAVPGGARYSDGHFGNLGYYGTWWTLSENSPTSAWNREVFYHLSIINSSSGGKQNGLSVRCVKD